MSEATVTIPLTAYENMKNKLTSLTGKVEKYKELASNCADNFKEADAELDMLIIKKKLVADVLKKYPDYDPDYTRLVFHIEQVNHPFPPKKHEDVYKESFTKILNK